MTLAVTYLAGLSGIEAQQRRALEGWNELPRRKSRSGLRIASEVLREPMLALLLIAGIAYMLLGDRLEALVLTLLGSFSIAITIIQETRTQHVLEALKDLAAPRAVVVRDGQPIRVPGREVVRGDVVILERGDRVPADAVMLEALDFEVDESLLTGEALAVAKKAASGQALESNSADPVHVIYSGTLVTRGSGTAQVTAIGMASAIGRIEQSLAAVVPERPRLRQETAWIIRLAAAAAAIVCGLLVLFYGLSHGNWLDALLAGIALGMALLPEEIPMVLTIFLAMGAWRIAQVGVLTRKAAAIETLGSATVLCTDKTGTLTENRMAVTALWLPVGGMMRNEPLDRTGEAGLLLENAALASDPHPRDPMEIALHEAHGPATSPADSLLHSFGTRPDLLAVTNLWSRGENVIGIAAKGAPEAIADLCRLDSVLRAAVDKAVEEMAAQGMRVLGVAQTETAHSAPAPSPRDYTFQFLGLVGLSDPLRANVPDAVALCRSAGIRVVLVTGDHSATAKTIARQAGLAQSAILTGPEIATMSDEALVVRARAVSVFARVLPEQKLRIVEALKRDGEIVAMTGDGVNDAPALTAAHIGIAMGKRGTDVAREAAAIVLLEDDFASIVKAIRLGRRIYDNIRKAMQFIFAVHVPIAGLAVLPLVSGTAVLLAPLHIALLEMVIDPACALVFEAEQEEAGIMQRAPRARRERLVSPTMIAWSLAQGTSAFAVLAALALGLPRVGISEDVARGVTFLALVGTVLALILVNRTFTSHLKTALSGPNRALLFVLLGALVVILAIESSAPVRRLLGFGPLHLHDLAVAFVAGAAVLILLESAKHAMRAAGIWTQGGLGDV